MKNKQNLVTTELIQAEYLRSSHPWYVGFSGGKDSSSVLKLLFLALEGISEKHIPINLIYADTGVEIPPSRDLAISTLSAFKSECDAFRIPLSIYILEPTLEDRFFVKVIGRGYPTPTNKFRWCTRRLRTDIVNRFFRQAISKKGTLLLGVRQEESPSRKQAISRYSTNQDHHLRQDREQGLIIFAPIIDYSTEEIWATLLNNPYPESINAEKIFHLYKHASGECPIIQEPLAPPCGRSRFGCWICTVVRKDQTLTNLAVGEYPQLKPLLEFRNWIIAFRDDPRARCVKRRNGATGPGPFTLAARELILSNLLLTQKTSNIELIHPFEIVGIMKLWHEDSISNNYFER